MRITAKEICLSQQIVILLFSNIAAFVNVLYRYIAFAYHSKTTGTDWFVVGTGLVESKFLYDVLVQIALLEIALRNTEGTAVRSIGSADPTEAIKLEQVIIERKHIMNRFFVFTAV